MRTSKKGRGELRVGGTIPQAVALAVSMWPALVSLAAAADLPAAKRSAQEQVPSAKHGQQTETEAQTPREKAEHLEGAESWRKRSRLAKRRVAWRLDSMAMSRSRLPHSKKCWPVCTKNARNGRPPATLGKTFR